ncbi:hypothetical protein QEZ54_12300 [Catellatospora sp. KI3]|uniref:hypothetical protein n=1 Tax=Catellatospora sp. KI3 TaxID=3041620 RepID=UPI002482E3FD|nr:hypothetical protein [Catellatospora sp. KI3]MDI1461756.1 hypothetical protein [Catellatospora sp. KI3]
MTTIPRALLLAAAVLTAAAACTPAGSATPGPTSSGSPPVAAAPGAVRVVDVTAKVAIPDRFDTPWFEFSDAQHGYALVTWCQTDGYDCAARLLATADGGRSWQQRRLPVDRAKNIQLYESTPQRVIVWTDPEGYRASADGGLTYGPATPTVPRDHAGARARYGLEYPANGDAVLLEYRTGRQLKVPSGFPPGTARVAPDDTIWVTNLVSKPRTTARSTDGGATWQTLPVPDQPGRPLFMLQVLVSADGRDTWLVGDQEPPDLGGGTALLRGSVLKQTGLPLVWRLDGADWVPVPITGVDEQLSQSYAVAPAGAGLLALGGPEAGLYLGRDGIVRVPGTPRLDWVSTLPDGTLRGSSGSGGVLLGVGSGANREWRVLSIIAGG